VREPLQIGGPDDPLAAVWHAARDAAGGAGVYAVGGPVRDLLRGAPSRDADIAVEGDAAELARRLAEVLGATRVTVHKAFGTAVVRTDGVRIDIATTRSERYPRPAALPVVASAGIDADLGRRDFTVNALAAVLTGPGFGEVLDPFGGRADLESRLIRVLHAASFRDDPTRLVRAVRYAARLGLALAPGTEGLAREAVAAGLVDELSGARVRAELVALLGESATTIAAALALADDLSLPGAIHPALAGAAGGGDRIGRVDVLRERFGPRVPPWRVRLAVILRAAGESQVAALTDRLRLRRGDTAAVRAAATAPARLGARLAAVADPADVAELLDPLPLDAALVLAADGGPGARPAELYLDRLRGIRLEIDGTVLRDELGLVQSPRVGEVLAELLRRKRNGQLADRRSEIAAARELVGRAAS
jgi:tRNA nucleotidyltransferase (CCA-adding enzyme)